MVGINDYLSNIVDINVLFAQSGSKTMCDYDENFSRLNLKLLKSSDYSLDNNNKYIPLFDDWIQVLISMDGWMCNWSTKLIGL